MKKTIKKLLKDWQVWMVLCCGLVSIIIDICDKDWTEALWVFVASILLLSGKLQNLCMEAAIDCIDEQDKMLSKADVIIKTQMDVIKEMEDKLKTQEDARNK